MTAAIGAFAACALLAVCLIVPALLFVLGLMFWVDLIAAAWSTEDMTAGWATDIRLTGFLAVVLTAFGFWGSWAVLASLLEVWP